MADVSPGPVTSTSPASGGIGGDPGDAPLRIDIVSDVVCPWCVVGYRQLAIALERRDTRANIHWHPFELNPEMAPEGEELAGHIARKYGSTPEEGARTRERLQEIGRELGFAFRYADDTRIWPTFRAHRLLAWADEAGREHALQMALFEAYFSDGLNVGDTDVLLDVSERAGLERDAARAVLDGERYAAEVRARERFWLARGIRGVPAMVFDRQYLVSGAQGVERYAAMLAELDGRRSAEPSAS